MGGNEEEKKRKRTEMEERRLGEPEEGRQGREQTLDQT
jgi:hypothetical protein